MFQNRYKIYIRTTFIENRHIFNRNVVECDEFLALSASQVTGIIKNDKLVVPSEEEVSIYE